MLMALKRSLAWFTHLTDFTLAGNLKGEFPRDWAIRKKTKFVAFPPKVSHLQGVLADCGVP